MLSELLARPDPVVVGIQPLEALLRGLLGLSPRHFAVVILIGTLEHELAPALTEVALSQELLQGQRAVAVAV